MISKIPKVPLSLFLFFSTLNFQFVKRQVTLEIFFLFAWNSEHLFVCWVFCCLGIFLAVVLVQTYEIFVVALRIFTVACQIFHCNTWPSCPMTCGVLVPCQGNQTHVPYIGRQVLNHWTAREVPVFCFFHNLLWSLIFLDYKSSIQCMKFI